MQTAEGWRGPPSTEEATREPRTPAGSHMEIARPITVRTITKGPMDIVDSSASVRINDMHQAVRFVSKD